jgi:hypothetical protein
METTCCRRPCARTGFRRRAPATARWMDGGRKGFGEGGDGLRATQAGASPFRFFNIPVFRHRMLNQRSAAVERPSVDKDKTADLVPAGGQAPPRRKGHRHAGPNATVVLHRNRPPDNVKNTESEATLACVETTNPPLGTPLSRARGPQTRRTAPHSGVVSRIVVEVAQRGAPTPRNQNKPQATTMVRNPDVASAPLPKPLPPS